MHFEIGVVGVGLAGKQRLDFALLRYLEECRQRLLGLGDDFLVALLLAERNQLDIVAQSCLELGIGIDGVVQMLALAHHCARLLGVVPKIGVFGEDVQLLEPGVGLIPVKDASGEARGIPGFRRPCSALRHACWLLRYKKARSTVEEARVLHGK
jgi:hypothetical protein